MQEYARQRKLSRRVIAMPLLTERLSRRFLGLLTPVHGRVAAMMVDSLRNETVVHETTAGDSFAIKPRGLVEAIERALLNEDAEFAQTRWSDSLPPTTSRGGAGHSSNGAW